MAALCLYAPHLKAVITEMREKSRGARWVKMACKSCAKRTANAAAAATVLFAQIFCEWVSHKKGTVSVVCSLRSPKKRVKNKKKEPFQLCVRSPGTEPASGQMSAGFAPRRLPLPPAVSSHTRLIFRRHLLLLCSVALRLLLLSYLSAFKMSTTRSLDCSSSQSLSALWKARSTMCAWNCSQAGQN